MGLALILLKARQILIILFMFSHGAGRKMSRNKAKLLFSQDDLIQQTQGIECRKDAG